MAARLSLLACLALALPASAELLDPLDFGALGAFDTSAGGSFTIDTDALTITDDAAPGTPLFTGVIDDQGGLADSYGPGGAVTTVGPAGIPHIAVFTFSDLQLGAASSFTITGHRALALLSQGNATIDTALRVNGEPGSQITDATPFFDTIMSPLRGGPGGFDGGASLGYGVVPESGRGPSGGGGSLVIATNGTLSAGSGGHWNTGNSGTCSASPGVCAPAVLGAGGAASSDPIADVLRGGSGGGGAQIGFGTSAELTAGGAGGGGAIELGAVGLLTLGPSSAIDASAVAPSPAPPHNFMRTTGVAIYIHGGYGAGGAVRIHASRLVNQGSANVSARSQHQSGGLGLAGGAILLRGLDSELVVGQAPLTPEQFGALPGNGVFSLNVASTRLLPGETIELSGASVVQAQTATLPRIEVAFEDVELADGATAEVPAAGFTNAFELRLDGPGARVTGSGSLTNAGVLRGEGTVTVPVDNAAGGRVDVSSEALAFSQGLWNEAGGRVTVVAGTLGVPGDGLANDDGLVNLGTLDLVDATVAGDVRSPAGSTINVAGDVVFEGLVSGAGGFSGTQNLVVFEGGYSPGDP